jgi:hypothetical protein
MTDGFSVDLAALGQAAEGVNGTLDEVSLQSVSSIPHSASGIGHEQLASTLADFCDRWQRGVNNLTKDGREIATRLSLNVSAYRKADQDTHDKINAIFGGTGPDPGAR